MSSEVAEIALTTDKLPLGDTSEGRKEFFALLVERAKAGDLTAFEQIMVCTQRRVVRTAWRMLGNEEDAQDAAQEVFLRVYKYLARFNSEQDFTGWLYRITINVCRDTARKQRRISGNQVTSLEAERARGMIEALASPHDTEEAAVLAQERAMVARALAMLPEKERSAIVLRDMEGLSTEEVARILGSRPVTVRSQISSARVKIKLYCERFLQKGRKA